MPNDKPAIVARDAAEAAMHAAAAQAGKVGVKTSEFWVSILGAAALPICIALIPTPFGAIAGAGIVAAAAAYANSRGNVKAALAQGAMTALSGVSQVPGPIGEAAGVAGAVIGAAAK